MKFTKTQSKVLSRIKSSSKSNYHSEVISGQGSEGGNISEGIAHNNACKGLVAKGILKVSRQDFTRASSGNGYTHTNSNTCYDVIKLPLSL